MMQVSIIRFGQLMAFLTFSLLPGLAQSPDANPDNQTYRAPNKPAIAAVLRSVDLDEGSTAKAVKISATTAPAGMPDAPSAAREVSRSGSSATLSDQGFTEPVLAQPQKDERVATWPYWTTTGTVFGSNIAAIEVLQSCLSVSKCQSIPGAMRGRGAMYGVGMPVAAGVSYLDYYLKKKEKRWWYVPAVAATVFDLVLVGRGAAR